MPELEMCCVPADLIRRLLHWADAGWDSNQEFVGPDEKKEFEGTRREAKAVLKRAAEREAGES